MATTCTSRYDYLSFSGLEYRIGENAELVGYDVLL